MIATPFAVITAWSVLTKPSAPPVFEDQLEHPTIREGDATVWRGAISGVPEMDLAVAALDDAPWIESDPPSGVVTTSAVGGTADLDIGLRSTRWGTRPVERVRVNAASAWASFGWSAVTVRRPLTTLPLPALFDADASARPSDGLVGLHRSARSGEGNEFAAIRAFRAGDRLRRINWTRSARSNELQVNSTWADLDTHIALILDATDDFGISEGIDGLASSLDGAVRAAGAIAEYYAPRGERVSFSTFGTAAVTSLPPGTGRAQLRRILDTLAPRRAVRTQSLRIPRAHAETARVASGGQITVMLSPLIAPEVLDLVVTLGRQGMSVIVVDTLPNHVATDEDEYTALAWRIRLLERRRELRMIQTAGIPVVRWRGPGSLDQVIRDIGRRRDRPQGGPAMIVEDLQRLIDRLWQVSWQRWILIAVSVVAATAATTFTALAAGNQTGVIIVIVVGLALGAAAFPDSHAALAVELIVVWHWVASADDPTTAWVVPMSWSLLVFHTVIALMALTPITATVDRTVLVRWAGRTAAVAVAVAVMWILVVVMDERRAAGSTALTAVGLVTFIVLVLITRSRAGLTRQR